MAPALGLEGEHRPGHFRGVATVCLKLFTAVMPGVAYFGQKDAQQVAVVKQLVRDLNVAVEIRVIPIVRDADGLALSSRNARLSAEERSRALAIPRALDAGLAAYRDRRDPVAAARAVLSGLDVDYVAVAEFDGQPTLAIAARVGRTRLIDNAPLVTLVPGVIRHDETVACRFDRAEAAAPENHDGDRVRRAERPLCGHRRHRRDPRRRLGRDDRLWLQPDEGHHA